MSEQRPEYVAECRCPMNWRQCPHCGRSMPTLMHLARCHRAAEAALPEHRRKAVSDQTRPVVRKRDLSIKTRVGDKEVSTVALPIDHGYPGGVSLWYETMVFARDGNGVTDYGGLHCERYTTREQAEAGHARVVDALRAGTLDVEDA